MQNYVQLRNFLMRAPICRKQKLNDYLSYNKKLSNYMCYTKYAPLLRNRECTCQNIWSCDQND
jgi:hypothetical protein